MDWSQRSMYSRRATPRGVVMKGSSASTLNNISAQVPHQDVFGGDPLLPQTVQDQSAAHRFHGGLGRGVASKQRVANQTGAAQIRHHRLPVGASLLIRMHEVSDLSIRDLRAVADQPMANEAGDIWLSYNGEVYGWEADAEELKKRGYVFKTTSDTEFILNAYHAWGLEG